jgi:hypothetical protein
MKRAAFKAALFLHLPFGRDYFFFPFAPAPVVAANGAAAPAGVLAFLGFFASLLLRN